MSIASEPGSPVSLWRPRQSAISLSDHYVRRLDDGDNVVTYGKPEIVYGLIGDEEVIITPLPMSILTWAVVCPLRTSTTFP
jgi:hypothetical protein